MPFGQAQRQGSRMVTFRSQQSAKLHAGPDQFGSEIACCTPLPAIVSAHLLQSAIQHCEFNILTQSKVSVRDFNRLSLKGKAQVHHVKQMSRKGQARQVECKLFMMHSCAQLPVGAFEARQFARLQYRVKLNRKPFECWPITPNYFAERVSLRKTGQNPRTSMADGALESKEGTDLGLGCQLFSLRLESCGACANIEYSFCNQEGADGLFVADIVVARQIRQKERPDEVDHFIYDRGGNQLMAQPMVS